MRVIRQKEKKNVLFSTPRVSYKSFRLKNYFSNKVPNIFTIQKCEGSPPLFQKVQMNDDTDK